MYKSTVRHIPPAPDPGSPAEALAREVHSAWCDGMLSQSRLIPVDRLEWDTLSIQDRALYRFVASRVLAGVFAQTCGGGVAGHDGG
jgi:hypothetical protein